MLLVCICNEAINHQTSYLIDEAVDCGKGANTVISYVHHYLEKYNFGEFYLDLQADICSSKNEDNAFIFYLSWHILKGLNKSIIIIFY